MEVAKIHAENESSIPEITKKEKKIHAIFVIPPSGRCTY